MKRKMIANLVILGLTVSATGVFFAVAQTRPAPPTGLQNQPRLFFGVVGDQDGQPLDDVEIKVWTAELVGNPHTPGGVVPDKQSERKFSVYSGANGGFMVQIPQPHNMLVIEDVKKEGYDWVFDWAWTLSGPPHNKHDNRQFTFPGRFWKCPYYKPDPANPAVFPLHAKADPKPAQTTSRGGFEVGCDDKETPNHPVVPNVPSAGKGAPQGQKEIEKAIGEYLKARREKETGSAR